MEIKDRDELRKHLTEKFYILILRRGGTKQRIHKGNCSLISRHLYLGGAILGKGKARQHYHAFNTLDQALQKYTDDIGKDVITKFSNSYIPYCHLCLNKQRKEWLKTRDPLLTNKTNKSYDMFVDTVKYFCVKNKINYGDFTINYFKNGRRDEYSADHKTDDFFISVFIYNKKYFWIDMGIPIGERTGIMYTFRQRESIDVLGINKLKYFIDKAVYEYDLQYKPFNLHELKSSILHVYGDEQNSTQLKELIIFLNGVSKIPNDELIIYQFQHFIHDERIISYGFCLKDGSFDTFWAFFLRVTKIGGNGPKQSLKEIEVCIKNLPSNMNIKKETINIDYFDFKIFLQNNDYSFQYPNDDEIRFIPPYTPNSFGVEFEKEYDHMLSHYAQKQYSETVRQLRTLVDKAVRLHVKCSDAKIETHVLLNQLVKDEKIDEFITKWHLAFTSVANPVVHGNTVWYIDDGSLQITILLGMKILSYIEYARTPYDEENEL